MNTEIELEIATNLINLILSGGNKIAVNDGEDCVLFNATSTKQVLNKLRSTGNDFLIVTGEGGQSKGQFQLIWGNGRDVISNFTDNDYCNALFDAIN